MKIRIAALQPGMNQWSESISPSQVELDSSIYPNAVSINITADKRTAKIALSVESNCRGEFLCDRCGEPFQRTVGGKFDVMFIQREEPLPDEMPGDEIRSYIPGQEELDITTEIRDAILLSLPMKILCSDDCRGLCQYCGANLNIEACRCSKKTN